MLRNSISRTRFLAMSPEEQITEIMLRLYSYGMTTTSGGNISVRRDDGSVAISPAGKDKGTLVPSDTAIIWPDGSCTGNYKPSSEYPFHLAVYRDRPDIRAVLHAHPPALVTYSMLRICPDISFLADANDRCGNVRIAKYAVPGSLLLGEKINEEFRKGADAVLLENHGVCVGGSDLYDAYCRFETLDWYARIALQTQMLIGAGNRFPAPPFAQSPSDPDVSKAPVPVSESGSDEEQELRVSLSALSRRAYDNGLFSAMLGTMSARLPDGSFLIAPPDADRRNLRPEDWIRIKKEGNEILPFPSLDIHQAIYRDHPELTSVITARPPHAMAYTVSHLPFSTRTIPESYVLLRDAAALPYATGSELADRIAKTVSIRTPACLVDNYGVVLCGTSPLKAFDCLEVMEYSAKAMISAAAVGGSVASITEDEVQDIIEAFRLP